MKIIIIKKHNIAKKNSTVFNVVTTSYKATAMLVVKKDEINKIKVIVK